MYFDHESHESHEYALAPLVLPSGGRTNEVMYDLFVKFERVVVRNWHPEAVNL